MTTVAEIVSNDLCVGCGLCEAVSEGPVRMALTPGGSLRPSPVDAFTAEQEATIIASCPGVVAEARSETHLGLDTVWGHHGTMRYAWAADPKVRFEAATAGVLTALGQYLLDTETAYFVLHTGADPDQPMQNRWVVSESPAQVQANTGSRYAPTAPLAGLEQALARRQPFAVIAKPCDLGALHRLSKLDSRIDQLVVARLAMVCGGQSRLTKSRSLLNDLGVEETDVSMIRYRGHGNPGPTRVETKQGEAFEVDYLQMWEDEGTWDVETRCKICPDALGEASDVAVADVWPGGAPTGEDEGYSGIIVRSDAGEALIASARHDGYLVLGETISPREFDDLQPHQVRKKVALAARYEGMADAGVAPLTTHGLRVTELGSRLTAEEHTVQREGTAARMQKARQHAD